MREQSYRDPVHDFITLREPLFLQLVDTPEFQRLRRIRQLGASSGTYHGAEHSRFGHSLGAHWIMGKILDRFRHIGVEIDNEAIVAARAAALLHDVGHGPFSHALEGQLTPGIDHEAWTRRIVLEPTGINRCLRRYSASLPQDVADVLAGVYQGPPFLSDLVSSQLDVDRMDYLIRDSIYTGVTYGHFDLGRLINTLLVYDGQVVTLAKGVVAVEEYLLARYFMYWQVYLHKTTRCQELVMSRMWQRARDLWQDGALPADEVPQRLIPFLRGDATLGEFLLIDDYDLVSAAKDWITSSDPILADLAQRFLHRRLLKPVFKVPHEEVPAEKLAEVEEFLREEGWPPEYYLLVDDVSGVAYDIYRPDARGERTKPILALDESGRPQEITRLSPTMRALSSAPRVAKNLFAPEPVVERVRAMLTA